MQALESIEPLNNCRCVGAMLPPVGASCFDEAALVVTTDKQCYLRVRAYLGEQVVGDRLSSQEWQWLLADGQASQCDFGVSPLRTGVVLWALRAPFEDRDSALADLRLSGALAAPLRADGEGPNATWIALVVRAQATFLRKQWAERALGHALEHASLGKWSLALAACEQAFALELELNARALGLLVFTYRKVQRAQRAEGYLQVAERSKGEAFRREVEDHVEHWQGQLAPELVPGVKKSEPGRWGGKSSQHLRAGQTACNRGIQAA